MNYGFDTWFPPDPKTVPCCVLMSGYRPLPEAYCCQYGLQTDLEIKRDVFNVYRQYSPDFNGSGATCCRIGGKIL